MCFDLIVLILLNFGQFLKIIFSKYLICSSHHLINFLNIPVNESYHLIFFITTGNGGKCKKVLLTTTSLVGLTSHFVDADQNYGATVCYLPLVWYK